MGGRVKAMVKREAWISERCSGIGGIAFHSVRRVCGGELKALPLAINVCDGAIRLITQTENFASDFKMLVLFFLRSKTVREEINQGFGRNTSPLFKRGFESKVKP
jgi:hypothetical protein